MGVGNRPSEDGKVPVPGWRNHARCHVPVPSMTVPGMFAVAYPPLA